MWRVLALITLGGCRAILGLEDVETFGPVPEDSLMPPEGTLVDAPPEAVPMGCPAAYMPLQNSGPRAHRYLFLNVNAPWPVQRDTCAQMAGFLAFPDGVDAGSAQLELSAIVALGGPNIWVGVDDVVQEGVFRTTRGAAASSVTLSLFNPSGNPNPRDCLFADNPSSLRDEDCGLARKAVCECIP